MAQSELVAEPNLTPILDLVFQLITFFMLVTNFKSAELESSIVLPVVGSAKPVETKGDIDTLLLNVTEDGKLMVYGKAKDLDKFIQTEAQAARLTARRANSNFTDADELPTLVVIRADQKTPFKHLFRAIKTCQDNGFRNFAMKAMNKAKDAASPGKG
jgi:biopolymer transport protein ExbD